MRSLFRTLAIASVQLFLCTAIFGSTPVIKPVVPDALPEAAALLATLQDISGRYTLTGQHNPPAGGDKNSRFAANYTGKTPAVWTCDFGFAAAGDSDSTLARPAIVQEAIRQHKKGSIISLCWHAVPPTADEPVTFQPLPGSDPKVLKSVQGQLLDEQFKDVLTPGTALYNHWAAQVDVIAGFLKQLEEARVPILWRPYHEMNGSWFWWGGRTEGKYTTAALYRQLYDRLINHHHLKNLLWLWSMDRMSKPNMEHEKYFPGIEFVDVLGLDVYGSDFAQSYYDSLVKLSQGKPLALAEVGNPPSAEILGKQPLWTYYSIWSGMVRVTTRKQYAVLMANKRLLGLDDPEYADLVGGYRKACGLPPVKPEVLPANFSGAWVLNEDLSNFGPMGSAFSPARLVVTQEDKAITVQTAIIRESTDDDISEAKYLLDGSVTKTEFMKSPRMTIAKLSDDKASLTMETEIAFVFAPPGTKFKSKETWTIIKGDRLCIENVSDGFMASGKITQTFIFERR